MTIHCWPGSLISAYGVASCHGNEEDNPAIRLTYRDLIANFSKIVESVARDDTRFPKTLVVNAFRGYLNEFVVQQRTDDKENRAKGNFEHRLRVVLYCFSNRAIPSVQEAKGGKNAGRNQLLPIKANEAENERRNGSKPRTMDRYGTWATNSPR